MIVPTIGRVIWYHPYYHGRAPIDGQPFPALICYVHDAARINVAGFDNEGAPFKDTRVLLVQDPTVDGAPSGIAYATWMPYQREQASKQGSGVPASYDPKGP